jgi:hypothetical protein
MEHITSFDDFYEQKLSPFLKALEKQGSASYWWQVLCMVCTLGIIPVLAWGLRNESGILGGFLVLITIIVGIVSLHQYTKIKDSYESNYKEKVIQQIIEFIHPGLQYKPDISINHKDYINSSLCRNWYDDYDGADWIGGNYKGVNFKCSELYVTRRTGAKSSGSTVYKGLFFAAPLNISFSGGTYIWIKNEEQLPASIADERYRLLPMPEVVRVDCRDGEFEKQYRVYTTDVYEALSIVDGEMMQCISRFRKQINRDISLSFVAGICYVAIPFTEDLFEPKSKNPGDKDEIKKCFLSVLLMLDIINQLKLDKL